MVEVEVGVEDDVDLFGADAGGSEGGGQKLLILEERAHFGRLLVADAGFQ